MSTTLQLRAKGSVTIPIEFRQKYALNEGDTFTIIDMGDGSFFLVPRLSIVPKLVEEMETLRQEAGLTIDDLLAGLSDERRRLFEERYGTTQ